MANKTPKNAEAARQENIQEQVSVFDRFYNDNKKTIWTVAAAVVVCGLAILGYSRYIYQPKCAEAMASVYHAEAAFQESNWEAALNGDGKNLGFADVIAQYGSKAGKAVYLYAAICEYNLGGFDAALEYLGKYSSDDPIMAARAEACKGDVYCATGELEKAAAQYEKAAQVDGSDIAAGYLLKAGLVYEELGNAQKALAAYNEIKDQHPGSYEAMSAEKYIARVSE